MFAVPHLSAVKDLELLDHELVNHFRVADNQEVPPALLNPVDLPELLCPLPQLEHVRFVRRKERFHVAPERLRLRSGNASSLPVVVVVDGGTKQ